MVGVGAREGVGGAKVGATGSWADGCSTGSFVGGGGGGGGTDAGSMSASSTMEKPFDGSTNNVYPARMELT